MSFFSEDMLPMLGVFEAETTELAQLMDGVAARVERAGELSPEDVAELFRCAHTIKGSSAMMGLEGLSELTHRLEDLFGILRDDPTLSEDRVHDILDQLYAFSDYVHDEVGRMSEPDYSPTDMSALTASLVAFAATFEGADAVEETPQATVGQGGSTVVETPSSEGPDAVADAEGGAILKVSFLPDVAMVNARALVILKQLRTQVAVHSHVPEDLTSAGADKAIQEDGLLIVIDPADIDKAKAFLAKNSFVRRIEVIDEALSTAAANQDVARTGEAQVAPEKFVTLRWSSIHELQGMAGEFLLSMAQLKALVAKTPDAIGLRSAVSQTARLVDDLVYHVDKLSMVSMTAMVPQLSRMVRDMCRSSGKKISFEVVGGDIEIDRNLYGSISDPLLHIIRNAVDHGIETPEARLAAGKEERGKVTLSVENLGARVAFRVSDDGRGIDTEQVLAKAQAKGLLERPAESYSRSEILQMVMLAGLSTSREVTQYSGRGVGMDVVNAVVRDFNGQVDIESEPGRGTTMTLFMPVSVTSVESLCFRIGESAYHMALPNLVKVFTKAEAATRLSQYEGSFFFEHDKRHIPVLDIHALLGCTGEAAFYVICRSIDDEFVIGVDDVLGDTNCANKPLPSCLGRPWQKVCPVRNVAILDDGMVGYALNAALLADFAQGRKPLPDAQHIAFDDAAGGRAPVVMSMADLPDQAFVFELGHERFALPIERVERLSPPLDCSATPWAPPHLLGLANYRNRAIPVFDLAGSAGVDAESSYVLIATDARDESVGLAITSAIGVRALNEATLAEEQAAPRSFAAGLRTSLSVVPELKEPPVTLLNFA